MKIKKNNIKSVNCGMTLSPVPGQFTTLFKCKSVLKIIGALVITECNVYFIVHVSLYIIQLKPT